MHLMTSSNSLSGWINQVLVPCPDLVRGEGFHGDMQTEGEETQFWKLHRKKTLNMETPAQSKELQAKPGTKAVELSALKGLWGFGKKDTGDYPLDWTLLRSSHPFVRDPESL